MTKQTLEARLARVLRESAADAVRPIDAMEIAMAAMTSRREPIWQARIDSASLVWRSLRPQIRVAIAIALLAAALVGTAIVGSQLLDRRLAVVPPPDPSPQPTAGSTAGPGSFDTASLEGTWLATKPDALAFNEPSGPATLALAFEAKATNVALRVAPTDRLRLSASVEPVADGIRVVGIAPSDPITLDGVELAGCPTGDAATYRVDRSSDGLLLALSVVSDSCASRTAVLERTWVRSMGDANSGGLGVVTGVFDQPFLVKLPEGSYSADRTIGSITIVQPVPELQFLTYVDPQGFNDPCDVTAGRFEIEPGADAVVTYFQQLDGFTVDSTSELRVDGHRAIRLVVHANADAGCPSGARLIGWQTKLDVPTGRSWFTPPGVTDSLVIVELPGSTVMFEVLPAPNSLENEVIGSIRFLDEIPTSP